MNSPLTKTSKRTAKTSERKRLLKKLDELARERLFKTQPHRCVTCPYWRRPVAREGLQIGHFITRTKAGTRWDPDNLFIQCGACNLQHEHNSTPFTQFYLDTFGREAFDALVLKSWSREGKPYSITELREMIEQWKQ